MNLNGQAVIFGTFVRIQSLKISLTGAWDQFFVLYSVVLEIKMCVRSRIAPGE